MDRTRIYRNIHLIISLLLIRTSEISSKEYYCTKAGTWREAMASCTRSGGEPLSYRDVYNSTDFTLKDNRTVWTADFTHIEYVKDIAQVKTNKGYECGYTTFSYKQVEGSKYEYSLHYGSQYGQCTARKQYVCVSPTTEYLKDGISNWYEAFSECSSNNASALLNGYKFTCNKILTNLEIWDRRVRRVTQGTVNGTITIDNNNIETCGTNVEEMNRCKHNCEELLESVCVFDDTVQDTDNLTRACFEEQTTEVPVNATRRALVTSEDKRTSKEHKDQTTEVSVNVTRWPFVGSTIVILANVYENKPSKEHKDQTTEVSVNVTRWPFVGSTIVILANVYENKPSKEHKGQAGGSIAIVVATIIVSLTIFCILIGIGLYCYWKLRTRKVDEKNTTARYVNENLSTATTRRNPSDTNGSVNDRSNAVDIADEYYEAYDAPSGKHSVDGVYTSTKQTDKYGNVYSACRKDTSSENIHNAAAITIEESEYDSTRNIKEYEKSSNIYNTLGFEGAESVYDSGQYNTDKGLHVDSSTYSSCSIQDNTYNTTAELNGSRQKHGLLSSHDDVYSISTNDTNQHDRTYGNIGNVH